MDQALGIWELDKKVILILTFLSNVTGEIWNEYADIFEGSDLEMKDADAADEMAESAAAAFPPGQENKFVNQYIQVGDQIVANHVHCTKVRRKIILVACGRSVLINSSNR